QRVGTGDPARPYVEPCSRRERGAPDGGAERSGRDLVADIQQGPLEGNAHIDRVARVVKHVFDPRVIVGRYWQTVGVTYPQLPGDGAILSVWAHPDDESYCCAGLMAAAVKAGRRVVCVTATRGELGSTDPVRWPAGPPLAEIRIEELAASLAELGVTEHAWLDYPAGSCAAVD